MRKNPRIRVIVDTNCWISFLIGRRLSKLVDLLSNERLQLIICDELLEEIKEVTARPKFSKYFPSEKVDSLIEFIQIIGESFKVTQTVKLCRDEADNYLLALTMESHADYLVTGDDDLLVLQKVGTCKIVDATTFERSI